MELKIKTRRQLADAYGVDEKTLRKWLKDKGLTKKQGTLCPTDIQDIIDTLGIPPYLDGSFQRKR